MEQSTSSKLTIFKPPLYIYKLFKNTQNSSSLANYEIQYNKQFSLRKYSKHIVLSQAELQLYEWRKCSLAPIVKTLYIELLRNKARSSELKQNGKIVDVNVFTEHLEKTLAQIIDLRLEDALYVLKQCILGFQAIFAVLNSVIIDKGLIGLNDHGELKVWIHDDLTQNHIITNQDNKENSSRKTNYESFFVEFAIVNKIVHMVALLANSQSQYFFYGLDKFTFSGCLEYLNTFITNANLTIPENLQHMIDRRVVFQDNLFKSIDTRERTMGKKNSLKNSIFKSLSPSLQQFKNVTQVCQSLEIIPKQNKREHKHRKSNLAETKFNQNSLQVIRRAPAMTCSFKQPKQPITPVPKLKHFIRSKGQKNSRVPSRNQKQRKFSVQHDVQALKNLRPRPSVCVAPSFLLRSTKIEGLHEEIKETQSLSSKSISVASSSNCSKKCMQCSSNQQRNLQKNATINAFKLTSSMLNHYRDQSQNGKNFDYIDCSGNATRRQINEPFGKRFSKQVVSSNGTYQRARSSSENIKFTSIHFLNRFGGLNKKLCYENNQGKEAGNDNSSRKNNSNSCQGSEHNSKEPVSSNNQNEFGSSSNSTDNFTAKKGSFLTRTSAQQTDTTNINNNIGSRSKMTHSNLSIDNVVKMDNDHSRSSYKNNQKRSLMCFKQLRCQQILENQTFKQIQEQPESKSYNSSLQNTQVLTSGDLKSKNSRQGQSFDINTYQTKLKRIDSSELWEESQRRKAQDLFSKNNWKKTINNLDYLQQMDMNQSFIDGTDEVLDKNSHVKLQKLDKLGANMCQSFLKSSNEKHYFFGVKRVDSKDA